MTNFSWPAQAPNPARTQHMLMTNSKVFVSPITGKTQTAGRAGERWMYRCTWVNVSGAARRELMAILSALNGMEHRVFLPLFNHTQAGVLTGSPQVNGSAQTGADIQIENATGSVANWSVPGDWILIAGRLHQFTAASSTNASGQTTISISPPVRTAPPDNDPVEVAVANILPKYIMRGDPEFQNEARIAGAEVHSTVTAEFYEDV